MSYTFEIDDQTVWSPALRVGKLYVGMAHSAAEVLEVSTGMHAMASDFWEIDLDVFERFVYAMHSKYFSSNHQVMRMMIGAVLSPSIVMLERAGRSIAPNSPEEQEFRFRALDLSMAQ